MNIEVTRVEAGDITPLRELHRQAMNCQIMHAYEMGKLPAARCNVSNPASRKTLQKAGMLPCCRLLEGEVVS